MILQRDTAAAIWWPWKPAAKSVKLLMVIIFCFLSTYALFSLFKINIFHQDHFMTSFLQHHHHQSPHEDDDYEDDKQLGGLLPVAAGGGLMDQESSSSCLSRYQSSKYYRRKKSSHPRRPSPHLISKLRNYEALHKRCGPNTLPYNSTLQDLSDFLVSSGSNRSNKSKNYSVDDCKYAIWSPIEGLGNRMLTLGATFLYALLTNRVLLVGGADNLPDLFCEPFPEVSWLLSSHFPIHKFTSFNKFSPHRYGNISSNIGNTADYNSSRTSTKMAETWLPPLLYIHLVHDYDDNDMLFFCDEHQTLLQNVPWLVLKSDLYFVPSFFSVPSFQQELVNLFPDKETVFHHLSRYLFHPTNSVWGLISRYYETYLARADERLGIQIRVFYGGGLRDESPLTPIVLEQILACLITKEKLLPKVIKSKTHPENNSIEETAVKPHHLAVLVTSLKPGYYEEIKKMYWYHATVTTGESVAVYQPSHEEFQQTGNEMHDKIALAEMYLLSMTDKLVTSAQSTFGYVAQSLGGLRPWILSKPRVGKLPDPLCQRALSMEPCFHKAPVNYFCRIYNRTTGIPADKNLPYVRHCEDVVGGLKLFQD